MAQAAGGGGGELVSAQEYLRSQGAAVVVFNPCGRLLYLGLGCDDAPRCVPQCIAHHDKRPQPQQQTQGSSSSGGGGSSGGSWAPGDAAYQALLEAQRFLHLPTAPPPPALQQHQQQQQQALAATPVSPTGRGACAGGGGDAFPAAKAGLRGSKAVPQGADGFAWCSTRRRSPAGQKQQAQQQQQQQQQQVDGERLPYLAATQVAMLAPGEPYATSWLADEADHIAGMATTPEHVLLDRFEVVWGWALAAELGLTAAQRRLLAAVLLVPPDMGAAEVRLLAELLLGRLGFASLVVHLAPVAAAFGNAASCGLVVHIGAAATHICCVDDAMLLHAPGSRARLELGLNDVVAGLAGWMAAYGHWPAPLERGGLGCAALLAGGGGGGAAGCAHDGCVYGELLLQQLALEQCYYPKASINPGLIGQAMLEDNQPAVLPLRIPGSETVEFEFALGSWAAVAPMALFFPAMAPQQQQQQSTEGHAGATGGSSSSSGDAAAAAAAAAAAEYARWHGCVHDLPAAEAMYLQGQLKARSEAGLPAVPPLGLYLLPLELPAAEDDGEGDARPGGGSGGTAAAAAAGAGAREPTVSACATGAAAAAAGSEAEQPSASAAGAACGGGAGDGGDAASSGSSRMALDEAIFGCLMAAAARQPDVLERLAAGLLLVGPGAALRGLGSMLERRLMARFATAGRQQVVSVLEPRAPPPHIPWFGGALLAALDAGRENWLSRAQWTQAPAGSGPAAAAAGGAAGAAGALSSACAGRHAKLFYFLKAEQGML